MTDHLQDDLDAAEVGITERDRRIASLEAEVERLEEALTRARRGASIGELYDLRTELTALRTAGDRLADAVTPFIANQSKNHQTGDRRMQGAMEALAAWRTARKDTPAPEKTEPFSRRDTPA